MYRRYGLLVLAIIFASLIVESASAIPRRRRSRRTYYSSSGWLQVASKQDAASTNYRPLNTYCSYDRANAEEVAFTDRVRVFVEMWDDEVIQQRDRLVAEVKITDLNDVAKTYVRYVPVSVSDVADAEYKLGTFEINNDVEEEPLINPAKIYRIFINLHRAAAEYNNESAIGRLPGAYYVATSGDSVLDRARQHIVMKTFREWYYTERGWSRNAVYPMDCHAYYRWATGSCTVGASNGWANLGRLFGGGTHSGGHIPQLMGEGPIHGDYVRKPGHTFMLLTYDFQNGVVWTMEANFNSTIEILQRSVGSGWTVGHLAEDAIRQDVFQVNAEMPDEMDDLMARRAIEAETDTVVQ